MNCTFIMAAFLK